MSLDAEHGADEPFARSNFWNDILNVKPSGSIPLSSTRGAAYIMSEFNETQALDGLRILDAQAIGAIYDKYFLEIYRYVRYRVGDDSLAEDIASDVFVRMLEAVQKRQGPQTSLRGWLLTTASNSVNDHHRRAYRRPVTPLSDALPDAGPGIHSQIDAREKRRMLQHAIAQLTDDQQHVLALRFGQGYSIEETATLMKKNINAVKALQFRALASLQRQIGEVGYE
jgi:RNA polymerase sigma-70 factor (ECF subfamily)